MRTVLITGTSTGIGLVTAEALATRGWRVFATMRDPAKKDTLQDAVRTAGLEDRISIEQLDVTSGASIEAAVASILSRTGGSLDAVVHNAGTAIAGALEDLPDSEIRRVFETNFFGVLRLTRAVLPAFRAAKHGRVVIVSSEAAFCGQPLNSIYCASKWAVEGFAEFGSPSKCSPLASMWFWSSLARIARRSGIARRASSRAIATTSPGASGF